MVHSSTGESPKRRAKFLVGAVVVVFAVLGLVGWAMSRPGSQAYYITPSEAQALGPSEGAGVFRLNGDVVPGSIERDGLDTSFVVTDGSSEIRVLTDSVLPDTFRDRAEVVARGAFEGDVFVADQVLAKCPSKFKAKA